MTWTFDLPSYNYKAGDLVPVTVYARGIYGVDTMPNYGDLFIDIPTLNTSTGAYFIRSVCNSAYTSGSSYTNYNPLGTDGWTQPTYYSGVVRTYISYVSSPYQEVIGGTTYNVWKYTCVLTLPSSLNTTSYTMNACNNSFSSSGGTIRASCTLNISSNPTPMQGAFTVTSLSINEGSTVRVNVDYTNPANVTNLLYLTVSCTGNGITSVIYYGASGIYYTDAFVQTNTIGPFSNDVLNSSAIKQAYIDPDTPGRMFFYLSAQADYSTEGNESYSLELRRDSFVGPIITSIPLTINDVSVAGVKMVSDSATDSIYEGGIIGMQVEYTNNSQLYWSVNGTTADFEVVNGIATKPMARTINGTTKYISNFYLTPKKTTGLTRPFTFTAHARTTSTSGTIIATKTFDVIPNPNIQNQGLQIYDASGNTVLDTTTKTDVILDSFVVTAGQASYIFSDSRIQTGTPYYFYQGPLSVSLSFSENNIIVNIGSGSGTSKVFYGVRGWLYQA